MVWKLMKKTIEDGDQKPWIEIEKKNIFRGMVE